MESFYFLFHIPGGARYEYWPCGFYFFSLHTFNGYAVSLSFLCWVRKNYFPLTMGGEVKVGGNGEGILSSQNTIICPALWAEIRQIRVHQSNPSLFSQLNCLLSIWMWKNIVPSSLNALDNCPVGCHLSRCPIRTTSLICLWDPGKCKGDSGWWPLMPYGKLRWACQNPFLSPFLSSSLLLSSVCVCVCVSFQK